MTTNIHANMKCEYSDFSEMGIRWGWVVKYRERVDVLWLFSFRTKCLILEKHALCLELDSISLFITLCSEYNTLSTTTIEIIQRRFPTGHLYR